MGVSDQLRQTSKGGLSYKRQTSSANLKVNNFRFDSARYFSASVVISVSESAKYSKHLINRVLHGAPTIEVIFLREEKPVLALLMLSAKQGSHWFHF